MKAAILDIKKIKNLYDGGMPLALLARKSKCAIKRLREILLENGFNIRPARFYTSDERHYAYKHGGRATIWKTCPVCGKGFYGFRSQKACSKTCSKMREGNPQWNGGRLEIVCEVCGKILYRKPSAVLGHSFCSRRCIARYNWKGGKRDLWYSERDWRDFRKNFLLQTPFLNCSNCGTTEDLTLHHKLKRKERPDLELSESNINLFCRRCHLRFENIKIYEQQFLY